MAVWYGMSRRKLCVSLSSERSVGGKNRSVKQPGAVMDSQYLDQPFVKTIDDPVVAQDHFAYVILRLFGNNPSRQWKQPKPFNCVYDTFRERLRVARGITTDEFTDRF